MQSLLKEPVQKEKKMKTKKKKKKQQQSQRRKYSSDEDDEQSSSTSSSSDEDDEVVQKRKKSVISDSDSDIEDEDAVMDRLPENTNPLLDFASASQGILLLLVLKQHLKNLYGFSDRWVTSKMPVNKPFINSSLVVQLFTRVNGTFCLRYSKIQKYSPTESAKVYDKAVNRKSKVHFNPRQTLDYLKSDIANIDLSYDTKKNIVKQYLDVSIQYYVYMYLCVI